MNWLRWPFAHGFRQMLWLWYARRRLGACGERVELPRDGSYALENLFLGNDVTIGMRSVFWAVHSKIVFGDHVMCGPEILIMGGDHNLRPMGRYMKDLGEQDKEQGNDLDVVIEEDVWIGARVVLLKGVCIGRGAVIGAGSVVRGRVPPYSIAFGNPARPKRMRGGVEEILAHEAKLYPPERRLPRSMLEAVAAHVLKTATNGISGLKP